MVKFWILLSPICVHVIVVFGHFNDGMVKYGKTLYNLFFISSDITGVALMTLEAASNDAYSPN